MRTLPRIRTAILTACLLAATLSAAVATPAVAQDKDAATTGPAAVTRGDLLRDMSAAFRAGDLAAADAIIRQYLAIHPDDGGVLYNLACVRAELGDPSGAVTALESALEAGFSDLAGIETDPDLATLRERDDLRQLLADTRDRLRDLARDTGQVLVEGVWSRTYTLRPNNGAPIDAHWPEVTVRFRYSQGSLGVEATIRADHFNDRREPWLYGDAVLVDVVLPDSTGLESARHFTFAFGLEESLPTGVFLARHGQSLQQRVMELSPKIKFDAAGEQASYSIVIPWRSLAPYAPPLDEELGLNALYTTVGADGIRRVASLVPAPRPQPGRGSPRRYALFRFAQSLDSLPVLRGRPSTTVVGADPLRIELLAWTPEQGGGNLEVRIQDLAGESVVRSGPAVRDVTLAGGLNRWTRDADLSALPSGPFRLETELHLPSGESLTWGTPLLRLDESWLEAVAGRMAEAPQAEQPTLALRRQAIASALASHDSRDDPTPIANAVVELGLMARRAETLGSALPDSGLILAAYRDRHGQDRTTALWLPPGHATRESKRLLLVLPGTTSGGERLVHNLAAALSTTRDVVVLVPEPPAEYDLRDEAAPQDARDCLHWWRERLGDGPALLAGLDRGAADALHLSLRNPEDWSNVLLLTGGDFAPWPGRDLAGVQHLLQPTDDAPDYTLVDFAADGGQGALAAAALAGAGFDLADLDSIDAPFSPGVAPELIRRWLGPVSDGRNE